MSANTQPEEAENNQLDEKDVGAICEEEEVWENGVEECDDIEECDEITIKRIHEAAKELNSKYACQAEVFARTAQHEK